MDMLLLVKALQQRYCLGAVCVLQACGCASSRQQMLREAGWSLMWGWRMEV